jgi:hypothetical protein
MRFSPIFWIALAGLVAIIGVGVYYNLPAVADAKATAACEKAVKPALTAPASASFHSWTIDGDTVRGSVDSQNGFGALLTSSFECRVVPNGTAALISIS